ncbi:MAG: type III pantothenate kinase [Candidatus Saccharibacteria bacterium]|nr:type III pantothenate kinase [Moraxellaceae bacterium]
MTTTRKLWLDLGNTRLKYWLTEGDALITSGAELHLQSPSDLLLGLVDRFSAFQASFVGVSSVLDSQANLRIKKSLAPLNTPIEFAQVLATSHGLITGYDQIEKLGIDRWLQVLALSGQQKNFCIVGCGTALTLDMLDDQNHLGGYILPSFYLQREALAQGTRRVQVPDGAFSDLSAGRNTQDAVHHGILLGLVGAIEKLVRTEPTRDLVLTGGDAELIQGFLDVPNLVRVENDLLLKGLRRYFS